jgi:hypothetical protein
MTRPPFPSVIDSTLRYKTVQLFKSKVAVNGACWEWQGALDGTGYGRVWDGARLTGAHRLAYRMFKGPISDACVLHHCDNPRCVHPDHLFLGSHGENARDKAAKGRAQCLRGSANGNSILSEAQVLAIRQIGRSKPLRSIAAEFGITVSHAHDIIARRTWQHL